MIYFKLKNIKEDSMSDKNQSTEVGLKHIKKVMHSPPPPNFKDLLPLPFAKDLQDMFSNLSTANLPRKNTTEK